MDETQVWNEAWKGSDAQGRVSSTPGSTPHSRPRAQPRGRAAIIEGGGHYPMAEFPEKTAAEILPFIGAAVG
ncbi:MAG: alpha/beta fold hydrolase [Micromonosporaceae bacterium]